MKLPHAIIVKSPGLLPMRYSVRELAEELKMSERTLRDWLNTGAPHERDNRQHIWIIGTHFSQWVQEQRKPKRERKLLDHQAYCLRCKDIVELKSPEHQPIKGKLVHIKGVCPHCGCIINRGARNGAFSE
ncbi:MAG: hypothetical protein HN413_00680 [Chloroflexi bacterium]|nr:hypothetical protein [Chloroflexota bacterium]